jgi:hypothetical protein
MNGASVLQVVLDWVEQVSVQEMLIYWAILILAEQLILRVFRHSAKASKYMLFNLWEFFGFGIPVFWLLRISQSNKSIRFEVALVICMAAYYALYRPACWRKAASNTGTGENTKTRTGID